MEVTLLEVFCLLVVGLQLKKIILGTIEIHNICFLTYQMLCARLF